MNKYGWIVKIKLMGLLGFNRARYTKDSREKFRAYGVGGAVVFTLCIMAALFSAYCYVIGKVLHSMGAGSMLPGMMMTLGGVLCLITTIVKGSAVIFGGREDTLLMAMPIPKSHLISANLTVLYGMNLFFTVLTMIPAVVVYSVLEAPNGWFYAAVLPCTLLIPVLPIIAGTCISIVITWISSRFRAKNLVLVVLAVLCVIAIMAGSFSMQTMSKEALTNLVQAMSDSLYRLYPPARLFVQAVCGQSPSAFVLYVGISVLAAFLFVGAASKIHDRIRALLLTVPAKGTYQLTSVRTSKPLIAMVRKEWKQYTSSSVYVINTGIGVLLLIVASVALLINRDAVLSGVQGIELIGEILPYLIPFVAALFLAMTNTADVSISLEGRQLPLLKSLPLRPMTIFQGKILLNLMLTAPAVLISMPILAAAMGLTPYQAVLGLLLLLEYAVLFAALGIAINLCFPNFDWSSDVAVVKQSMASFVGIFGGFLLAAIPAGAFFLFPPDMSSMVMAVVTVLIGVLDIGVFAILKGWGSRRFQRL